MAKQNTVELLDALCGVLFSFDEDDIRQVYGRPKTDTYTWDKFNEMRRSFPNWFRSLDLENRRRFARRVEIKAEEYAQMLG